MVLTSAAASTQTTILPTARTTLSMAVYKALPESFAACTRATSRRASRRSCSAAISIVLYARMNYSARAAVSSPTPLRLVGLLIAFYYGLTGFACAWYYRKNPTSSYAQPRGCRASCRRSAG